MRFNPSQVLKSLKTFGYSLFFTCFPSMKLFCGDSLREICDTYIQQRNLYPEYTKIYYNLGIISTPLQYSCLENPMDGGAWWAAVHGVAKSRTKLSDFPFTFHFHALEKEMATHSSVLAWRIPGTGEPGGLPSMGSHRVGHD